MSQQLPSDIQEEMDSLYASLKGWLTEAFAIERHISKKSDDAYSHEAIGRFAKKLETIMFKDVWNYTHRILQKAAARTPERKTP